MHFAIAIGNDVKKHNPMFAITPNPNPNVSKSKKIFL